MVADERGVLALLDALGPLVGHGRGEDEDGGLLLDEAWEAGGLGSGRGRRTPSLGTTPQVAAAAAHRPGRGPLVVAAHGHWTAVLFFDDACAQSKPVTNPNTQEVKLERFFNVDQTKQCAIFWATFAFDKATNGQTDIKHEMWEMLSRPMTSVILTSSDMMCSLTVNVRSGYLFRPPISYTISPLHSNKHYDYSGTHHQSTFHHFILTLFRHLSVYNFTT